MQRKLLFTISSSSFIIIASLVCGGGRIIIGKVHNRFARRSVSGSLITSQLRLSSSKAVYHSAFVSAAPPLPSFSRRPESTTTNEIPMESSNTDTSEQHMTSSLESASCEDKEGIQHQQSTSSSLQLKHPDDPRLWLYHVETTTSTMDEAKNIVESYSKSKDGSTDTTAPTSFMISATSQSNGRGTTKRNWKSAQRGNALFTIGIPQSSWMNDLKFKNDGRMVPLTLLPLKIGSLVAIHTQKLINKCSLKSNGDAQVRPRVTVKWPNDILLHTKQGSHEKIAGILIESSHDWFLVGIGINVGYAPDIPREGADYGRRATSLSQYCSTQMIQSDEEEGETSKTEEEYWIELSKKLAIDISYDLHRWLHPEIRFYSSSISSHNNVHSAESILNQWKSYIDWDMELTLRDTPKRERVILKEILEDGRVVVQEVDTGSTRTLVSDYFL